MAARRDAPEAPDLNTQYEAILASVWAAEQEWQLDERITRAVEFWDHRRPHAG